MRTRTNTSSTKSTKSTSSTSSSNDNSNSSSSNIDPLERKDTFSLGEDEEEMTTTTASVGQKKLELRNSNNNNNNNNMDDPERAEGPAPKARAQALALVEEEEEEVSTSTSSQQQQSSKPKLRSTSTSSSSSSCCCCWTAVAKMTSHRFNVLVSFSIFLVLVGIAAGMIVIFNNQRNTELQEEAITLAEETGAFFSDQFDNAILPLFSLAQFVAEIPLFRDLPNKIGQVGVDVDALPFIPGTYHRNITNVCDDPQLVEKFNQIASTIKKQSKMDGILVNLQIAPDAVVCLIHPLNNTEDFEPPIYMDNTGAIGHDLLSDPKRSFIARATIPADDIVVAGPLTMQQCQDCDPTVEKAFIARLPIALPNHSIAIRSDGEYFPTYYPNKWGFAVAILNWNALIERSGIYEMFQQHEGAGESGWEFQLTRTDRIYDAATGMTTENEVILAATENFHGDSGRGQSSVRTSLETTNNMWHMTVSYDHSEQRKVLIGASVGAVVLAFLVSALVFTILNQRRVHQEQLKEESVKRLADAKEAARNERDLNDFIAHEIRNPLSAAMSACSFVSASVHETQPLVDEKSKLAVQEDVHIIQSSLQFMNDLLRNMLDHHRVASKQMVVEMAPTDIQRDVLDAVASMLYQRYASYQIEVICPEDDVIILADRVRLKQVILNLARNSAKFVEKGYIRLRTNVSPQGCVSIAVEDSGPGIPLEKRKNMFERFQDSLDSLQQGTGVGLNLCQNLVHLMGGRIFLDESYHSDLEGCPGARFVIELCPESKPMVKEDLYKLGKDQNEISDTVQPTAASPTSSSLGDLPSKEPPLPEDLRVLFVDDDLVLRKLFCRSVKKVVPNWSVREASCGEAALDMLRQEEFDLIFLDQYMTSTDKCMLGTEAARAMRQAGYRGILCGLSANDMEEAFKSAGADAFMMKPFPCAAEPMLAELRRVLSSPQGKEM